MYKEGEAGVGKGEETKDAADCKRKNSIEKLTTLHVSCKATYPRILLREREDQLEGVGRQVRMNTKKRRQRDRIPQFRQDKGRMKIRTN